MSAFSLNASPQYPFSSAQNGYLIAASTTSATVAVTTTGADSMVIANTSAAWAWVTVSNGAVASVFPTGTPQPGFPVPPGGIATYSLTPGADGKAPAKITNVNAILTTGTGNIYISLGSGA